MRISSWCIAMCLRLLVRSWRLQRLRPEVLDAALRGQAILALWHGEQLTMIASHINSGFCVMTSQSRDGEYVARVVSRLGFGVVRGSTGGGGSEALAACRQAVETENRAPVFAVDGSRGPFHHVHTGALVLAARLQLPVVYAVSRAKPAIRLNSWDRFVIPLPFARLRIAYGRMEAPSNSSSAIAEASVRLAEEMEELAQSPDLLF